ncbi:MAG: carbon-nitrogen family hydrolase [Opitutae bacterium]|jgi:omega-amidase|nr:carbon-nitrogen family hydrolase [Opitutae bacterium]
MRIYGIQADLEWEDKDANFTKIRSLLDDKMIQTESLIVLPETFSTGFSMNLKVTAMNEPGQTESFLSGLAQDKKCWVTGGLIEPTADVQKGINRSVTFSPIGEKLSGYGKVQPAAIYREDEVHEPGDRVDVFALGGFQACPLICYDLRFPELFRIGMQKEANLFIVIACWPKIRIEHWITLLKARAIENLSYVIGINRVGSDPNLVYGGRSLIIDPKGEILTDGGEEESVVEVEIDPKFVEQWREEFPVLNHARPEFLPPKHSA